MKHLVLRLFLPLIALAQTGFATDLAPREVRAVWLTTLMGLDWPRQPATTPEGAARQQRDLRAALDRLQQAGINTVLLQTRVRATTIYPSAIEPWDAALTGQPGRAPLYDPLAFAIEECHRRKMELHAWVVAFPAEKQTVAKQLGGRALVKRRPDLCLRAGDAWMLDPGAPGTADYLAQLCDEIVRRYDIDGIHLDYIRYPERGIAFDDRRTFARHGAGQSLAAWRADNVTRCVQAVHDAVKVRKPWVKLSCSPVGKYADLPRQSAGGWNARDAVSQRAQEWLRDGLMDMLFPMMYFQGNHFYPFAADWREAAGGRPVVPGLGVYLLSPSEKDWPLEIIAREMAFLRSEGMGHAFFRARFLTDNVKGIYDFTCDFNARSALPPPMTWQDSVAPATPHARLHEGHYALRFSWAPVDDAVSYNVYRYAADGNAVLIAPKVDGTSYTYAPYLPEKLHADFAVTALDRYGNESAPCRLRNAAPPPRPRPFAAQPPR